MWHRKLCGTLVLAGLCIASGMARADEAQDIEKLHRAGETEKALSQADAYIATQPRAAQVRFLKGVMLADLKRDAEAMKVFIELTEDFPELADPYNNLAVLYAAGGQFDSALLALQTALRNNPQHAAARENLGDLYFAMAMQAWSAVPPADKMDQTELKRKLRLARELMRPTAPATAQRAPG
jgi:colicin import membrane protein